MSVTEFKRGVPTYKDKDDNEFGLLCETKEVCVTDNDGVSLEYKLQTLMQNITSLTSELQSCAKTSDLAGYVSKSGDSNIDGALTVNGNSVLDSVNFKEFALSLNGGDVNGKVNFKASYAAPVTIDRLANGSTPWLAFLSNGTHNGQVGISADGKLVFMSKSDNNARDVLHTGNSVKVVVSQTAPSDTSSLWVW